MYHEMRLFDKYFEKVKTKEKIYEIRLNDEKRKKINVGDTIVFKKYSFSEERINVKVTSLQTFSTFNELYKYISLKQAGFDTESIGEAMKKMYNIYTEDEEKKWGVILIGINSYANSEVNNFTKNIKIIN